MGRAPRVFEVVVRERRVVAEGTVEVVMDRPPGFVFRAGQHLQVQLHALRHPDHRGPSRVFSIASSPTDRDTLAIVFRETGSGFKRTVGELPPGQRLLVEGPHGHLVLPRDPDRRVVLIAGGVGVVPFRSMLRHVADSAEPAPWVTLLYASRTRRAAAFLDELRSVAAGHPRISLHTTFGSVGEAFLGDHAQPDAAWRWYVAGPPGMVDVTRSVLQRRGVPATSVLAEHFEGY